MKKLLLSVIILIIIIPGTAIVTKPSEDSHKTKIKEKFEELLNNDSDFKDVMKEPELNKMVSDAKNNFYKELDENITITDYMLFSTGKIISKENEKYLSIGLYGKIYTLSGVDELSKKILKK